MFLKKKWFTTLFAIITISILTACGSSEESSETVSQDAEAPVQDAMQDSISYEFMPFSDALEQYSLWFRVEGDPHELTRNSTVDEIFIFEDGKVQQYRARGISTIEDLIDMSDEEIIETVINNLHENDEDFIEPEPMEYTLDINLDDVGRDTRFINLETVPATIFSVIEQTTFQTIFDTHFSGLVYNREDRSDWDEHIITRVEDPSILFKLDDANTNKDIVTIEKGAEFEELRKELEEEQRKAEEERKATNPTDEDLEMLYMHSCASCHGAELSGGMAPQLAGIGSKLSEGEIYDIVVNGQGAMPGGLVDNNEAQQLAKWLSNK